MHVARACLPGAHDSRHTGCSGRELAGSLYAAEERNQAGLKRRDWAGSAACKHTVLQLKDRDRAQTHAPKLCFKGKTGGPEGLSLFTGEDARLKQVSCIAHSFKQPCSKLHEAHVCLPAILPGE